MGRVRIKCPNVTWFDFGRVWVDTSWARRTRPGRIREIYAEW